MPSAFPLVRRRLYASKSKARLAFCQNRSLKTTVSVLPACFYALKLEVSVGAYKCKNCGNEFVPTYAQALNAMHIGTTRYLKCPKCNKRSWCKKVIKK